MRTLDDHTLPSRRWRGAVGAVGTLVLAACATYGAPAGGGAAERPAASAAEPAERWPVKTREHVDLWLHGYALLTRDTATVPLFAPGYRERMLRLRAARGVTTALDANVARLEAGLRDSPVLVNGQFVPLYFAGWEELREAADLFLQAEGNPRRAATERGARVIAFLAASFPSAAERDWLRLFLLALDDERDRFYGGHWAAEQERRAPVTAAVHRLWQGEHRPRLQRFLDNTRQASGDVMLSLPLGGEGRTVGGRQTENVVAVGFPDSASAAVEAVYVLAHEVVGPVVQQAVDDHTTPAEKRDGVADRLQAAALVRGGMLLLERAAPELADGYARHYLRLAGRRPSAAPAAELARAFPLAEALAASLAEQIAFTMGGI